MAPIVPCPVLVGRAMELEALVAALDETSAGRGGLGVVVGEPGIGKSRLVQELLAVAADRGMRVLRGRSVDGSAASPYRPLAEALGPVVVELHANDELTSWLPALAGVVPSLLPPTAGAEPTVPVRGEALLRVLAAVFGERGGVLVLEDLHWADHETLELVEYLGDNAARARVLCLATVRSGEASLALQLARRLSGRRAAMIVELGHLNAPQMAAMVYSCAGDTGADKLDRVIVQADGVPFLVEEMLATPGLPASFAESVAARLAELSDADRRVLVVAAAFGRHFDWRLLPAATGLGEDEVVDALDRGVAAQLVGVDGDGFRFRHALTADAVLASVTPPRRRAAAKAALAAFDATHGEVASEVREVAARLAEGAGDSVRAGRLLLGAGGDAIERGALRSAIQLLERAVQLLPAGDDRDRAVEQLTIALSLSGRVDEALGHGRALVGRLTPRRAAALRLRLAAVALTATRWRDAGTELDAARGLAEVAASPTFTAELALRDAEFLLGVADATVAVERARDALDLARGATSAELECEALQLLGRCERRSSLAAAEPWFREALAVAEEHSLTVWRLRSLHELGTIGLLERSEVTALVAAQELAESIGAMATAAILDVEIAAGYAGLHDLDGELRHGMQAVQRGGALGFETVTAAGSLHIAGAAALRHDVDEMARAVATGLAAAPANRDIAGLLIGATELTVALLDDDLDAALTAAERSTELLRGSESAPPAHFRSAWPLLLAVLGRPDAAAAAAADEVERAGVAVNRAGRGILTMARAIVAGRADRPLAAALAVTADDELTATPFWRFLARRFASQAAAVDGWSVPEAWVEEATEWFRANGFDRLAEACSEVRPDTSHRWSELGVTKREAEVLALVIEGCANREIAERLYLSVRTVEKHVESLMRKTATKSRTQLARVADTT